MKRDPTVLGSLVLFLAAWVLALIFEMPHPLTREHAVVFHVIFWIMVAAGIRIGILWVQTLFHAVSYARSDWAVWVLAHIVLGPVASYIYYFNSRKPGTRTSPSGRLRDAAAPQKQ